MYLTILLLVVFVACFASLMTGGLWSNTITLINILIAGLLAMNYFEPLAAFLERQEASAGYIWDFLAIWVIFGVSMLVLRAATDYLSNVKVKFFMPVEKVGGIVMALWASWIVMCFTTATLHTAPLARNFLGGAFQSEPDAKMFFGLGPDRVWLGWTNRESRGAVSRISGAVPFDPFGDFIFRYGTRRRAFEDQMGLLSDGKGGGPK